MVAWEIMNGRCGIMNVVWESWMEVWGDHDCFFQDSCMLARGTVDVVWGIMNGRLGHHEGNHGWSGGDEWLLGKHEWLHGET